MLSYDNYDNVVVDENEQNERNHVASFKQKIKVIIALRDLDVGEVVKGSEISWQHFSTFLKKENPSIPSFATIKKIAAFLKVPASYLSDDNIEINLDLSRGITDIYSRPSSKKSTQIRDLNQQAKRSPGEIERDVREIEDLINNISDPLIKRIFEYGFQMYREIMEGPDAEQDNPTGEY